MLLGVVVGYIVWPLLRPTIKHMFSPRPEMTRRAKPSDDWLADFPLVWDEDQGLVERIYVEHI